MTPIRSDELIRIRRLTRDDAGALHDAVRSSIESLAYWLPWCRPDYSLRDADAWIAYCSDVWRAGTEYPFGIFSQHDGALLGGAGISKIDPANRSGNLGYWVAAAYRGRHIAPRAVKLAAAFAFEELGLCRLEIVALTDNRASQRVAEKVGAAREGIARNRLMFNGAPSDAVVYSLVPGDVMARPVQEWQHAGQTALR